MKTKQTKDDFITMRVPVKLKRKLIKEAEKENRTLTNYILNKLNQNKNKQL